MQVKGQLKGAQELVNFDKVVAVFERTALERGPGEAFLLTQKIKADGRVYENGSRQTIVAIEGSRMRFGSGLELRLDDGRVRQGDAVTTYKAQGASKTEMIRVEDNRSLLAMANREDLHVAFTRHRAGARIGLQKDSATPRTGVPSEFAKCGLRSSRRKRGLNGVSRTARPEWPFSQSSRFP